MGQRGTCFDANACAQASTRIGVFFGRGFAAAGTQWGSFLLEIRMGAIARPASRDGKPVPPGGSHRSPADGWHHLQRGIDIALADLAQGRADLRAGLAQFDTQDDAQGRLIAGAALVQFIGIAGDDYAGFQDAVDAVTATSAVPDDIVDADHRLLARTGSLVVGWYRSLDDPGLAPQAEAITRELGTASVAVTASTAS